MTNEEKRIKIAEACGWKCSETTGAWCIPACWEKRHHGSSWVSPSNLPDYLSDLNACHEMEKTIWESSKWYEYVYQLDVEQQNGSQGWGHATASQRAEAFGKTMNLW